MQGLIHAGDTVLIGPDSLGQFTTTTIRSIERKRIPVPVCSAGQSASFALKRVRRKEVRKGMVVLPKLDHPPKVYREFVAEGTSPTRGSSHPACFHLIDRDNSPNPKPRHNHQNQIPSHAPRRPRLTDLRHHRHRQSIHPHRRPRGCRFQVRTKAGISGAGRSNLVP